MMFSTTSAFIIITLAATATALEDVGVYVVGGKDSSVKKYPSIVQVEERDDGRWSSECGAVIITKRTVITAAHCIVDEEGCLVEPHNLRIRAGSSKYGMGGRVVRVRSYKIHPDYDEQNFNADIALLTLRKPLKMSNVIQPARLVPSGVELPDDLAVQVAGWGHTGISAHSKLLQEATVYTINNDECSLRHDDDITEDMICAGILDVGGRDACVGDSGGPLFLYNMLVGIVSWGAPPKHCGSAKFPGVYTKVSAFTKWIKSNAV